MQYNGNRIAMLTAIPLQHVMVSEFKRQLTVVKASKQYRAMVKGWLLLHLFPPLTAAFLLSPADCCFLLPINCCYFWHQLLLWLLPLPVDCWLLVIFWLVWCQYTKHSRYYTLAKPFWLIHSICALKIWYNWISNLWAEVFASLNLFKKGGNHMSSVYSHYQIQAQNKEKKRPSSRSCKL